MKKPSIPIALMVMFDWPVGRLPLVVGWRSATARPGGLSATMHGEIWTVMLHAVNLAFNPMVRIVRCIYELIFFDMRLS